MGDICFSGSHGLITFIEQNWILYAHTTDIFNGAGYMILLLISQMYS